MLLVCACGDDGSVASTEETTGTGDGTAAQTAASLSAGVSSNGDGTTSTGDETTSSSEATGSTQSSETEGSGTSTGGDQEACLPAEIFAAIDQHAHDLAATAGLLATHPSASEVTSFLLAPGLPNPPALPASFAGLIMPCSEPTSYVEFCEMGRCSQIECTGEDTGWIGHLWIEPAIAGPPWSFDEVLVHNRWDGGSGTQFEIEATATGPGGVDVSFVGSGVMDVDEMSVTETFAALHPAGETVLEYADDATGYSGQLTIDGVVVADVDGGGHLVATGDCPIAMDTRDAAP